MPKTDKTPEPTCPRCDSDVCQTMWREGYVISIDALQVCALNRIARALEVANERDEP